MRLARLFLLLAIALPAQERLDHRKQIQLIPLDASLHHVQGIDTDGKRLWVTSVDAHGAKGFLTQFELPSGKKLRQVEVQEGQRMHPGGISLDAGSIWVPVAEYDRDGPSTVQQRDAETLQLKSRFEVADHIGCIAAAQAWLVGANWDARKVYHWSRDGSELEPPTPNPAKLAWQDIKVSDGRLVASGVAGKDTGAIEWLNLDDLSPIRRIVAGKTDRGVRYTNEGMAVRDGKLYLLPEDGQSRLFVFSIQ